MGDTACRSIVVQPICWMVARMPQPLTCAGPRTSAADPQEDEEAEGKCPGKTAPVADNAELVRAVRRLVATKGAGALACDDFGPADIAAWTSNVGERRSLEELMRRVAAGDVEYLTIRGPSGEPVSKCGVNYVEKPGAAVLFQFDTKEELRGLGLGTALVAAAEKRIVRRGIRTAELGVELENTRARSLYERLGYSHVRDEDASWPYEDDAGDRQIYVTRIAVLRKSL